MSKLQIEVGLFGAFRQWEPDGQISLEMDKGSHILDLKKALQDELMKRHPEKDAEGLLAASVFADEREVLGTDIPLENGMKLAVLPPVCGG